MREAIWATFHHYCSTDKNSQHEKCPIGPDSWCSWQRAAAALELSDFHHDYESLPEDVVEAIRPIYTDLSNKKLLERCVGSFTHNNNESYNQLSWKITPKIVPCGSKIVEIAANIAAGVFNGGTSSLLYYTICMQWECPSERMHMNTPKRRMKSASQYPTTERRKRHEREEWLGDITKSKFWRLPKEWRAYCMALE